MNPIQIIGGGLAGLSLGIALRQKGVPVGVSEAGHYPRHRVCGEFISGQGRAILRDLGVEEKLLARGAREARTAAFYSRGAKKAAPRLLPEPALCVSRYVLDQFLADEFRALGGQLNQSERWRGGYGLGVVRATGHASETAPGHWRWFGLKAHIRHACLEADLEMHLVDNGYVGLCRLDNDTVNVCGLFRSHAAVPDLAANWRFWLEGSEGSILRKRLQGAEFVTDTFCSTAGLSLDPQRAAGRPECRIGDAITMIAPLTGNGMSMAFESAVLASDHLFDYSRGHIAWSAAKTRIAQSCDAAFRQRLFWGRQLQRAAFHTALKDGAVWLGMHSPLLWRQLFDRTR